MPHVAVDGDLAFAQRFEIDDGAQRPADEALDFLRAAALLAGGGFAAHAVAGGARQHAVFGRHPALAAVAQPRRRLVFQAGGDEHMRVAELDETGAFGMFGDVALEGNLAHLIGFSAGRPHCELLIEICGKCFRPVRQARECRCRDARENPFCAYPRNHYIPVE